ncbi:GGDEF domain-containing protein [Pseudohongiella sp.]|uniref:GGDEF domain-containing protein n=1 Tax=marine sediment metagenome TaxID=412755 RepID=A0A0F9WDK9_9ZZZZ|nr:GGDEF domain-containing protein [Pseudohongiella sp.]HDZ09760.1 GGDEF domain-containing protein [Pseudohongiella sp.]HEA61626.1 GGDEF domain-containing protein [Pseudohongiella sp.]
MSVKQSRSARKSSIFNAQARDLEFYTRVMIAVSACGISFGLPFALYHLFWGSLVISGILLPVVVLQIFALVSLIRRGFNAFAAWSIAIVQTGANIFFIMEVGMMASYWLYASGVANYYILDRRPAVLVNALACLAAVVLAFDDPTYIVRYCAAFAMINIFLYTFSVQLEKKNNELDLMLTIDPLTRVGNRTAMDETLLHVKNLFERYATPATVIMIDLDNFKRINDTLGHSEGDKVLCRVAEQVQARLRPTDTLYRYGGEEFIVVAENTSLSQASFLAEGIRQRIASHAGDQPQAEADLTVSIGVAQLRADESTNSMVDRADKALYKAKSMGRNWVCFDGDHEGEQQQAADGNDKRAAV